MSSELIFQGISTAVGVIGALKNAFEIRKLTREQVLEIALDAEKKSVATLEQARHAATQVSGIDQGMEEAIRKKVEQAKEKWKSRISGADDPSQFSEATDEYKSVICALLRNMKSLGGGKLGSDWNKLWADLQCG